MSVTNERDKIELDFKNTDVRSPLPHNSTTTYYKTMIKGSLKCAESPL